MGATTSSVRGLTVATVAVASAAGLAVGLGWVPLPFQEEQGGAPHGLDDDGLLAVRVGDRLVYEGDLGRFDVRVRPLREVRAANQSEILGLPLVTRVERGGAVGWQATVLDARHGGLAVSAEGCVVDASVPCNHEADVTTVSWEECPLSGDPFAPVDVLTRDALEGSEVTVRDPVKGTDWTLSVDAEGSVPGPPSEVTFTVENASEPRQTCPFVGRSWTVDLDRELVTRIGLRGGGALELVEVERGEGPRIPFGGGSLQASRMVEPSAERTRPYPPGAGSLGPDWWTLEQAWDRARRDSDRFSRWLADHPDAVVFRTEQRGQTPGSIAGTVEHGDREHEWRFILLAPDRSVLNVTASKTVDEQGAGYDVTAKTGSPPSGVPAGFEPPPRHLADLQAFNRSALEAGFESPAAFPEPSFSVLFDAKQAEFSYDKVVHGCRDEEDGCVSDETLSLNANTGRVPQVRLPRGEARPLVGG